MDLNASSSFLDQLQNQLHPDSTPEGSNNALHSYEEQQHVADEPAPAPSPSPPPPEPPRLDVFSEELFPALPATAGVKHVSANWAPAIQSRNASAGRGAPAAGLARVNKVTERFEIPEELQAKLQNEQGKSITAAYVCKQIMTRLGTSVDLSTNSRTRSLTVIVSGKAEAVKQTKREIISALTLQLKETVSIPISVRPHLVGKAGANIKALMARTLTKIDIARPTEGEQAAPVVNEFLDEEPETEVVIIGDYEGVDEAKKAIDQLVAQRTSKRTLRMSMERSYFPFISGPNGSQVQLLQLETGTRIHVPPVVVSGEGKDSDILIVGERSAVLLAEEKLKAIYEEVKRTTRTLQIPVKKRQHRFIIGPKGAALQEILEKTGCHVELPPASDASDSVTIRGPDNMLSNALQLVIEKSNSVVIDDVDIAATISSSIDPELFVRFMYTKERAHLKSIESTNHVTISQTKTPAGTPLLEVQGKTKAETDAARAALYTSVKEWGNELCFGIVEIPSGLHKFVIGKGGQNIAKVKAKPEWEGRLVDVVVSHEADESDEVIIVVKRVSAGTEGHKASDEESRKLIERVREELEGQATTLADLVTITANVDAKYHGRLIGTGAAALKELLAPYGNSVIVRFPKSNDSSAEQTGKAADPNAIVIRGPKKTATEVQEKLLKQVADWRHVELMSSFSEVIRVPKGFGKRLVGNGKDLKWVVTAVREKISSGEVHKSKINEKELAPPTLNLRAEVDPGTSEDVVTIYGPKTIVELAKSVMESRAQTLADTVTVELDLFAEVSAPMQKLAEQIGGDIRQSVLRRVIGKEGRGIKKLSEKHNVHVRFVDRKQKNSRRDDETEEQDAEAAPAAGKVTIEGAEDDVRAARTELIADVDTKIRQSYTTSFTFPRSCLPHIVGRAGSNVQKLKDEYNVRIDFKDSEGSDEVECHLEGALDNCSDVEEQILLMVDDQINTESTKIHIPSYLHKLIIGPAGARIRALVEKLGGQDKIKIQFPRANGDVSSSHDAIAVKANKKLLAEIRENLIELIHSAFAEEPKRGSPSVPILEKDSEDSVQDSLTIPKADGQRVAGRTGDGLIDVMRRFNVTVWFHDSKEDAKSINVIIVAPAGKEADVKAAKAELASKVRVSQNVAIPQKLLDGLRSGGDSETILASLHDLAKRVRQDAGILPEIEGAATTGTDEASLIVRGDAGSVAKAVKHCEKLLNELQKFDHMDRFKLSSELRPHIIGRQGLTIARLRTESGADIEILRNPAKGGQDTVVIRAASAESVAQAREMIDRIVSDQEERLARDKEREAATAQRESARTVSGGEARIDDDHHEPRARNGASYEGSTIPGYSGRAQTVKSHKARKLAPEDRASATPSPSAGIDPGVGNYWNYVESAASKKSADVWKEVPAKKTKGAAPKDGKDDSTTTLDGAPSETGMSSSKKNKKKKKKAAAAATDSTTVDDDAPALDDVSSAPIAEPATVSKEQETKPAAQEKQASHAKPSAEDKQAPKPEAKTQAEPKPAAPKAEPKAKEEPKPAPAKAAAPKPEPQPAPASKASEPAATPVADDEFDSWPAAEVEDEWKTVNTAKKAKQDKPAPSGPKKPAPPSGAIGFGSIPTMPPTDEEEAAKKKKKNKNKKKKKAADSEVVMPGDE
ncbi:hypothetical protein HDU87_002226 [Geranomyces variabilis]|uniref:K Homology domain-containing protein n=1 Tax=Geranomyces variabilis TaxID=109894 RepID=A0AAD5TLD7_9FUNG|nr:hypothetical protein HDU87_002226 [Geranomyces variabilis]